MAKEKLWTKNFISVSVVNFLMYIIHFTLFVTITSYTVHTFHVSEGLAGLAAGIFIIGMLFGRLGAGRFVDTLQLKYILLFGVTLSFLTIGLYYIAHNLILIYIIRFAHGLAFGISSNATSSMASKIVPKSRKGEGIGYYSLSNILASAIGPFIGIMVTQMVGFEQNYLLGIILILVSLTISLFISPVPKNMNTSHLEEETKKGWQKYLDKKALPISIVIFIVGFSYSSILSYITSFAETMDIVTASSFFFICYALVSFLSRPVTGKIFDQKGPNYIIFPTFLFFAIGLIILALSMNSFLLIFSAVFVGLGYGTLVPSAQTVAIKSSPSIGVATSTFFIFLDLGSGIGPFTLGTLIPIIGYRALYLVIACLVLVTMGIYYLVQRKYYAWTSSHKKE